MKRIPRIFNYIFKKNRRNLEIDIIMADMSIIQFIFNLHLSSISRKQFLSRFFIVFTRNYSFLNAIHINSWINHGNSIEFILMANNNFYLWKPFWRNKLVNQTKSISIGKNNIRKSSLLTSTVFIIMLIIMPTIIMLVIKIFINF